MACFLHELPIIVVPIHLPKFPQDPSPISDPQGDSVKKVHCQPAWFSGSRATVIDDHQDIYTHIYLGHCGAVCVCVCEPSNRTSGNCHINDVAMQNQFGGG